MMFNAKEVLLNRQGDPFREPKAGEKPKVDQRTGANLGFEESQKRDVRYGDVAMGALDSTLEGDEKHLREAPDRWVRAVMRREEISRAIAAALNSGDGLVDLEKTEVDLLKDRLAVYGLRMGIAMVGPVMTVLERQPAELARKANGVDRHADGQQPAA